MTVVSFRASIVAVGGLNGIPHHICAELQRREGGREKKSGLKVYSLLSAGCNTKHNKLGERVRKK